MTMAMRRAALFHDFDRLLAGAAIREGDPGYRADLRPAAMAAGKQPILTVPATDVIDVAQVIELSRSADLELPVRAGGHSS